MRRPRKKAVWILAEIGLIAVAVLFMLTRAEFVEGFSREDVAQIKKAVRKEVWGTVFPDWSGRSFRQMPERFWVASHTRIGRPSRHPDGMVTVMLRDNRLFMDGYCNLQKQNGRWVVMVFHPVGPLIDVPEAPF